MKSLYILQIQRAEGEIFKWFYFTSEDELKRAVKSVGIGIYPTPFYKYWNNDLQTDETMPVYSMRRFRQIGATWKQVTKRRPRKVNIT